MTTHSTPKVLVLLACAECGFLAAFPTHRYFLRILRQPDFVHPMERRKDASRIYSELRSNLLRTLLGGYQSTGYFWEQYDDRSGRGLRSHPFTGWTALVVLIMAEIY